MKRIVVSSIIILASFAAIGAPPPVAPIHPVVDDYFGTKVTDNYRWMENLKDPQMQKWMKAQADYTRTKLDALPGYAALLKRIDELNTSEPAQAGECAIAQAVRARWRQGRGQAADRSGEDSGQRQVTFQYPRLPPFA